MKPIRLTLHRADFWTTPVLTVTLEPDGDMTTRVHEYASRDPAFVRAVMLALRDTANQWLEDHPTEPKSDAA